VLLATGPILFFGWLSLLKKPMLVLVVAAMIGVSRRSIRSGEDGCWSTSFSLWVGSNK
jgi:hypothetical protein